MEPDEVIVNSTRRHDHSPPAAGEVEPEESGHKQDMEVTVNGKSGPTIKFSIGLIVLVQAVVAILGLGVTFQIMKADVDTLKLKNQGIEVVTQETLKQVIELRTNVQYLTEEVRYYREKTDRLAERNHAQ